MTKNISILKATSEIGAGKPGAGNGPNAVLEALHSIKNNYHGSGHIVELDDQNNLALQEDTHHPHAHNIQPLTRAMKILTETVENTLAAGFFPLILSGDHSNAIGAVSGFKNYHHSKNIGIIWVDAHLDLHSPYTTPSGNIHGMALNALIANDNIGHKEQDPSADTLLRWQELKHLGSHSISPKVDPKNIVFIGIRDFEPEESALVKETGMHVFTPADIKANGMEAILAKALAQLEGCDTLYISFDVDSMDPSISSGTGTPVPGGLTLSEAEMAFKTLFNHPKTGAFEITEVNPSLESDNQMAKTVAQLLGTVL